MPYSQLTHEQRCRIEALNASGLTQSMIARRTGVSQSTISRELSRNAPESAACGHHADSAQAKAVLRRIRPPQRVVPEVDHVSMVRMGGAGVYFLAADVGKDRLLVAGVIFKQPPHLRKGERCSCSRCRRSMVVEPRESSLFPNWKPCPVPCPDSAIAAGRTAPCKARAAAPR